MIEILKIIGSALVTASVTIYALHIKRIWDKQDKRDESNDTMEDKIDNLAREVAELSKKVEKLSSDLDKEITDSDLNNSSLQAGLREMLYDRIKHLCKRYETEGEIREEEYNSLNRMWQVYHNDLGGNGYLNGEMEAIEALKKI